MSDVMESKENRPFSRVKISYWNTGFWDCWGYDRTKWRQFVWCAILGHYPTTTTLFCVAVTDNQLRLHTLVATVFILWCIVSSSSHIVYSYKHNDRPRFTRHFELTGRRRVLCIRFSNFYKFVFFTLSQRHLPRTNRHWRVGTMGSSKIKSQYYST